MYILTRCQNSPLACPCMACLKKNLEVLALSYPSHTPHVLGLPKGNRSGLVISALWYSHQTISSCLLACLKESDSTIPHLHQTMSLDDLRLPIIISRWADKYLFINIIQPHQGHYCPHLMESDRIYPIYMYHYRKGCAMILGHMFEALIKLLWSLG